MSDYRTSKKPKRVRYHFSLVFFAAVLIFGFFFYKYMKNSTLEDVLSEDRNIYVPAMSDNKENDDNAETDKSEDTADSNNETGAETADGEIINPVPESEAADKSYLDSCVFIGDSLTLGMSSYGVVPASSVYASVSMNVSKAETELVDTPYGRMTALEALKQSMPENIYIMLGSHGAAWMSASEMFVDYTSFIKKVKAASPDSRIFIVSVPPVTAGREESKESPVLNKDLDSYNEKLFTYANENDFYYLDINTFLKDENGALSKQDAENDGMHFKYSTYEKLIEYVLTHTAK